MQIGIIRFEPERLMYIISCTDDELKRWMLECDVPTQQQLVDVIQKYERVQADTSGTRGKSARVAMVNKCLTVLQF